MRSNSSLIRRPSPRPKSTSRNEKRLRFTVELPKALSTRGVMGCCHTGLVARTAAAEAATPTAAATAAPKTAAAPAAEASASILTRLSFVHGQTATVEFRPIEFIDGGLTFFLR